MVNSTQETSPAGGSGDPKLADPSAIWPFDMGTCCQSLDPVGIPRQQVMEKRGGYD